ncbi:hypothetical protein SNOG_16125 [Parastagonospora nodorum SN15]|uniref:BTB domain-containing protein n=1 Tax=Phaeosphaeria nodorum (strain SN15 / ATCC MYA-4574 / FGSC 10173) TaxID=321614 RepID=Q0TWJ3_PHANO|nr:hypothetical protein SNOG_16125 [Parastagonospora nodorum SN15]KAH4620460.1 hypothetical protein HBH81_227190 [Parastagonospora nodorum]EAT76497.1 hypothetical protein SNOG_16125 [Parastagonospora nodorum SN15]KAH4736483.1 hypothetical protein HBH64_239050 [Parastagonospora nodorum]KAH4810565.1 hypothetical protein HBH60_246090 [Parastagonospora nodorum]KAH5002584.1 hypothetical protein HBI74_244900 [Parastagonospora nodorum]
MDSSTVASEPSLFDNELFSDVTIRQTHCGSMKEYHAHKAVLRSGSQWFTRALTGNFQV